MNHQRQFLFQNGTVDILIITMGDGQKFIGIPIVHSQMMPLDGQKLPMGMILKQCMESLLSYGLLMLRTVQKLYGKLIIMDHRLARLIEHQ